MGNDALDSNIHKQFVKTNDSVDSQHLHNKHFKKWREVKSSEKITVISSKKQKSTKKVKTAVQKTKATMTLVASVSAIKTKKMKEEEQNKRLKEKYLRIQKEKFINRYKTHCRCDHIKSVGNGL